MRRKPAGTAAAFCLVVWVTFSATEAARAESAADQVRAAVDEMHDWVGQGANGQRWREYLKSDLLLAELSKGRQADEQTVADVLEQYRSDEPGLDERRFAAVRDTLTAWKDELDMPAASELPAVAGEAKDQYVPVGEDDVARAKESLAEAVKRLAKYLNSGPHGGAWKKYLNWDQFQAQLESKDQADLAVLGEIYRNLTANFEGLEKKEFSDVAGALRHSIDVLAMANMANAQQQYEKEIENLAASLEQYAKEPTAQENERIGQRLGWFEGTGQARRLVRGVRGHYSHPNLQGHASAALVAAGLARDVDEKTPITDLILGTHIEGTGRTAGRLDVALIPSPSRAVVETRLSGKTNSETVGYNGPVTIYSNGLTTFTARKRILLDETGFRSLPANSQAVTRSSVQDVSGGRMATRVAWKRIGESRGQVDAIASRHAEDRVSRRVDEEAAETVTKNNERFQNRFRKPLLRRREFPERLNFSTSSDALHLIMLQANRFQLGAPDAPPELDGTHDLALRVHESLPNNLAAALLAGRTLTDEEVRDQSIEIRGSVPEALEDDDDKDPWSITFARRSPVTVLFADEGYKITIRGQRYTSGDREFAAMNVTAAYKIEKTSTGVKLTRQGELEILPPGFEPGKDRLSASQVALRTILQKKFGKIFTPERVTEGLELPGQWKKIGKLHVDELASDGGWLKIGWKMPPAPAVTTQKPVATAKKAQ